MKYNSPALHFTAHAANPESLGRQGGQKEEQKQNQETNLINVSACYSMFA